MKATTLTLRGESAHRFADAFVDEKADESRRSLNKRGVRNIHRYEGTDVTQIAYERASAHLDSWLLVSLLLEPVDEETATLVVMLGGGGEGPFKLDEVTLKRVLEGEEAVGATGRLATVLKDVRAVCELLDLDVETEWESDADAGLAEKFVAEIFE
ncbi:hypothetical protein EGH21_18780 [Halomicroarcula sp. F13]|uniref:Uncharacterized protein n=1 Tax=Haloarcula rubra TaxID=2487747 RepID=A0AAW4PXL4_9EURY|nr:hypothetical protein [Halomicroarcula rubra]MBX0325078.1 hypothetical protein [Halomicroarcula rubra]